MENPMHRAWQDLGNLPNNAIAQRRNSNFHTPTLLSHPIP
jgi:hypothetical protein